MVELHCQMHGDSIPAEIYEPWGGSYRVPWIGWLVFIATVVLACGLLAPIAGLLVGVVWLAIAIAGQIFLIAFRRYRKRTYLFGTSLSETVCRKRIAARGGYPIVTVEFDWDGHRRQSSAAVGMNTYLRFHVGQPIQIRARQKTFFGQPAGLAWVSVPVAACE